MKNRMLAKVFSVICAAGIWVNSASAAQNCSYENGQWVSGNEIRTPGFVTSGPYWTGWFEITNVSDRPITIRMAFTDVDGNEYTPYSVSYHHHFNASNTPINLTFGGTLQPGQLGLLGIKDDATNRVNIGKLEWSADGCINEAVMATMYNQYNHTSEYDSGWLPLNGGMAF